MGYLSYPGDQRRMVCVITLPKRAEIDRERHCPRGRIVAQACGKPALVDLLCESRDVERGRIFLVMMSQLAYNFIYTAITKGFSEVGRFKLPDIVTAFTLP